MEKYRDCPVRTAGVCRGRHLNIGLAEYEAVRSDIVTKCKKGLSADGFALWSASKGIAKSVEGMG